jgi:hypothetical protein
LVSTRDTKKLATDALRSIDSPASSLRSSPRRNASAMSR